jgi:hypothetical protein
MSPSKNSCQDLNQFTLQGLSSKELQLAKIQALRISTAMPHSGPWLHFLLLGARKELELVAKQPPCS